VVETQCMAEANRHVSNLFGCDSLASAASLLMMSFYINEPNPKAFFYATTAFNIAKMVLDMNPNEEAAKKICSPAKFFTILYDPSLNQEQRNCLIGERLTPPNQDNNRINTMINVGNVTVKLVSAVNFNFGSLESAVNSLSLPCNMPDNVRTNILEVIRKIEDGLKFSTDIEPQLGVYMTFSVNFCKFVVSWRSGNMVQAFTAANNAVSYFSNNKEMLRLWFFNTGNWLSLLSIPYFYQQYGNCEKASSSLLLFDDFFNLAGKAQEFNTWCSALNLSITNSYSLIQIEQELLQPIAPTNNATLVSSVDELSTFFCDITNAPFV